MTHTGSYERFLDLLHFTRIRHKRFAVRLGLVSIMLGLTVGLQGCVASSKFMAEAPKPVAAFSPTAGMANVVFIRSSGLGGLITFVIIDQNGRFIGDATAGAHFAVQLPPGEYLFIAEGENTAVMHANLAPERVYYVEVEPRMGILSARVELEPIKPTGDVWKTVPKLLHDTTRYVPLPKEGQAALESVPNIIQKRIANAKEKWGGYSAAERAQLSLEPADGAGGATPQVTPSVPPAGSPPPAPPSPAPGSSGPPPGPSAAPPAAHPAPVPGA